MRILYFDLSPEKFVHRFLTCVPNERKPPIQIPPTIFHSAFYQMIRDCDFINPQLKSAFELNDYGISQELKRFLQSAAKQAIIVTRDEWTFDVLACPDTLYEHYWPEERSLMRILIRDFFRRSDYLLADFTAKQKTHA